MAYQLYPHQQDLLSRSQQAFLEGYKAPCIVLGCGGGKSVIIAEMIRQSTEKGNRVLFLVHRKELKDQITITLLHNDVNMDLVTVGMVQTIVRRLDKLPPYNLIVIDENHHALANSYRKIIDYFNTFVMGFTATPIRLNGDGLGDVNDALIEGVSNKWLIENNYLAPYEYYSINLADDKKLKKSSTGDYTQNSMSESLGNTIYGDVIRHYRGLIDGQKTILYAHNVEYSQEYSKRFNDAGIPASHIDAKTPKHEREQIIDKFRTGEILVLSNVDILGEGFDVPDCTAVMLLRPTESLSLHVQQSMRPMRYRPNKKATIIDHVGNVFKHGFPDTERTWSLEKKKKQKRNEAESFSVWECPIDAGGCGMVYPKEDIEKQYDKEKDIYFYQCPDCEFKAIIKEEEKKFKDAQLEKLDNDNAFWARRNWKKANSYRELTKIAKAKGYKASWAAFKAKELGLSDTPSWVSQWKPKEKQDTFNFNF